MGFLGEAFQLLGMPPKTNMDISQNDGLEKKKKFGTPGFLGLEGIDRKLEDVACRSGFS